MYPFMKESGFRVRVDEKLRQEFLEACRGKDLTASQVIRAFMRTYVEESSRSRLQNDLFVSSSDVVS